MPYSTNSRFEDAKNANGLTTVLLIVLSRMCYYWIVNTNGENPLIASRW